MRVTIVGAGVIGLSWARLFADHGWDVTVNDPRPDLADVVAAEFGDGPGAPRIVADLAEALADADFVQEAGPERLDVKRELYLAMGEHTRDDTILASSSSSLLPTQIAEGNPAAARILIGHPFNPVKLMPLVEVVPGRETAPEYVERAVAIYRDLGKTPIALKKEIPGFVGNRLQKAINDQAFYLVQEGVITPGDLDELFKASLGLRYATVGPFESGHLGGGPAGIRHIYEHVFSQMTFPMGAPDAAKNDDVYALVEKDYGSGADNYARLVERRDRRTRAVSEALKASDEQG